MITLTRRRRLTAEDVAAARAMAQLDREQAEAERAARAAEETARRREAERAERKKRKASARAAALRRRVIRSRLAAARTVAPLLMVNASTVGAQGAYAYAQTPGHWPEVLRWVCAIVYAAAAETTSLYVAWHAHDALVLKAFDTAARLRRWSYLIALIFGLINYSHFAIGWRPSPFAVALGAFSLLSPWLWGLHTRRVQHLQLLHEHLVDEAGAQFSPARRRAFPIRSMLARRWSIDHHVRDPRQAWDGYRAEQAGRRTGAHCGRIRTAWAVLCGQALAAPIPAPVPPAAAAAAVVDESDPEIQACRRLVAGFAAARSRLTSAAGRMLWAGREPAQIDPRPTCPDPLGSPESAHEPEREPARSGYGEPAPVGPGQRVGEPTHEPEPADEPAPAHDVAARLAAAYPGLAQRLGRRPTGPELARAARCGKSTANRWMRETAKENPDA